MKLKGTHPASPFPLAALLLTPACSYRHEKSASVAQPPTSGTMTGRMPQTPFAEVRDQVIAPHCAGCHGAEDPEDDANLTDLASVRLNAAGVLNRVLVEQNMPPLPRAYLRITEKEKLLLTRWVSARMSGP